MATNAETLFDYLGKRYEDAYADSPNLVAFLESAIKELPAQSRVLDVGCGTGKPAADMLASAGHQVQGIDVSQEMVRIASSQVSGKFQKADMRTFTPDAPLDAVFVIFSLYQLTPGETYSMCYRLSEWLKPGGIVVVGTTLSSSVPPGQGVRDRTWNCVRQLGKPWMDNHTNETFFSEHGWQRLLRRAGFDVESEAHYEFMPKDSSHKAPETHHLLLARKVESEPLFGPYGVPFDNHNTLPTASRYKFTDRLVSEDLEKQFQSWGEGDQKILSLGCITADEKPGVQYSDGPIDRLPFPSGMFHVVLASWKLDYADDISKALQELIRVTKRKAGSKIVIIQGAPDNEVLQFLKSDFGDPPHQGLQLRSAWDRLAEHGFSDLSLQRIHAHYEFPEEDRSERCKAATEFLAGNPYCQVDKEDLVDRLQLHFQGDENKIDYGMVMLVASAV
ncbi:uncharacterized protein ACHE_70185A [Aspergillus chevalieri]|uniref:Methyltransferase domain-containing protein n=1 Tax=Aspergillus chevalieri TaxID=182096 RepID=A0A7R7VV44_ASPCH|nr:uncharacterized protein ACHE_70185A [Aspergillus chevalieri]BCR91342.1 hypothetical protein ACHE_70185A [Aspergillus chevalieri]